MTENSKHNIKSGIVAFYDILGYSKINENNNIEDVCDIITKVIQKAPENTFQTLKEHHKGYINSSIDLNQFIEKLKIHLISDSIIFFLPTDLSNFHLNDWLFFFEYAKNLALEMFVEGLPIRGAIDIGKHYSNENCFAGKPLINCYKLSNKLEFSGVVLTDEAYNKLNSLPDPFHKWVPFYSFQCPVNTKDGEKDLFLLDWLFSDNKIDLEIHELILKKKNYLQYIKQIVNDVFRKHNKSIDLKTEYKIGSTIKTILEMACNQQDFGAKFYNKKEIDFLKHSVKEISEKII